MWHTRRESRASATPVNDRDQPWGMVRRLARTRRSSTSSTESMKTDPPLAPLLRPRICGGPALSMSRGCGIAKSMTLDLSRSIFRSVSWIYLRQLLTVSPSRMSNPVVQPDVGEQVAIAYREHYRVMEYIVARRFRVPADDVRSVIHDVFLAFIRHRSRIRDERAWLVGATFKQCCVYWRARGGDPPISDLSDETDLPARVTDIEARVELNHVMGQLPSRCRHLLKLRFLEQCSSLEIARELATTVDYARKLVHRCMLHARELVSAQRKRS